MTAVWFVGKDELSLPWKLFWVSTKHFYEIWLGALLRKTFIITRQRREIAGTYLYLFLSFLLARQGCATIPRKSYITAKVHQSVHLLLLQSHGNG